VRVRGTAAGGGGGGGRPEMLEAPRARNGGDGGGVLGQPAGVGEEKRAQDLAKMRLPSALRYIYLGDLAGAAGERAVPTKDLAGAVSE
jgi:hypothetical protein